MENKHTPTPWYMRLSDNATPYIVTDPCVDQDELDKLVLRMPAEITTRFNSYQNAAFIVRAANSHAALVEACSTFAEWLRREEEGFVKAGNERDTPEGEAKWQEWFDENLRLCGLAQSQARAALALAKGEQP